MAYWQVKDENIMARFTAVKKGLTDRYGAPDYEKGKYLDVKAWWNLGDGYNVSVWIEKITQKVYVDAGLTFEVKIVYQHQATDDLLAKVKRPSAGKDY